jgi:hydroxymethylpyrimidine/phosphomethylpyrimidine kinase
MTDLVGRILIVAGSDSGGGAGIQADIKTVTALGGYAMTAITALTAQDTRRVYAVQRMSPEFVTQQMRLAIDDIGVDAIKLGMLGDAATVNAVADVLETVRHVPIIIDPVMLAKGGDTLLTEDGVEVLKRRLLPLAAVVTPNIPEAEIMGGMHIPDAEAMQHATEMMLTLGVRAVLLKGGHHDRGDSVVDLLATESGGLREFRMPRIATRHTHGTGCTLASAIATGMGQGLDLVDATTRARMYVQRAIESAPGFGLGHGPLNHAHTVQRFVE